MTTMQADRTRAPNEMTPELTTLAKELAKLARNEAVGVLDVRWKQGHLIDEALGDEVRYGTRAGMQLATFLGMNLAELYDLKTFSRSFSAEEAKELARRVAPNGRHCSYSHLTAIMRVSCPERRAQMLKLIFTEGLSVRELHDRIHADATGNAPSNRGRKPVAPKNPTVSLVKMIAASKKFVRILPQLSQSITRLDVSGSDDNNVRKKLMTARQQLENLQQETSATLAKIQEMLGTPDEEEDEDPVAAAQPAHSS